MMFFTFSGVTTHKYRSMVINTVTIHVILAKIQLGHPAVRYKTSENRTLVSEFSQSGLTQMSYQIMARSVQMSDKAIPARHMFIVFSYPCFENMHRLMTFVMIPVIAILPHTPMQLTITAMSLASFPRSGLILVGRWWPPFG